MAQQPSSRAERVKEPRFSDIFPAEGRAGRSPGPPGMASRTGSSEHRWRTPTAHCSAWDGPSPQASLTEVSRRALTTRLRLGASPKGAGGPVPFAAETGLRGFSPGPDRPLDPRASNSMNLRTRYDKKNLIAYDLLSNGLATKLSALQVPTSGSRSMRSATGTARPTTP